jgi:hypothetical protein
VHYQTHSVVRNTRQTARKATIFDIWSPKKGSLTMNKQQSTASSGGKKRRRGTTAVRHNGGAAQLEHGRWIERDLQ